MLKSLQGTGLADDFDVALLILAWAKVSNDQSIPIEMRVTSALLNDPSRALDTLERFEQSLTAFPASESLTSLKRLDPKTILPALEFALRLTETGLLQTLDPADISDSGPILDSPAAVEYGTVIPPEVASLLIDLADIRPGDTVYAPWDCSAQLSARAATLGASVYLEVPFPSSTPTSISLLAKRPFEVHPGDPIDRPSAVENGKLRKFDVAVVFPTLLGRRYERSTVNSDLFDRFREPTTSGDVLLIRHLLSQTRRRVVVASSNRVLFSAGAEQTLRKDLIARGMIEAVIAMPSGLLFETCTSPSFNLMILDPAGGHERIKFINVDSPQFRERVSKARHKLVNLKGLEELVTNDEVSSDAAIISNIEVLANETQLQVSRYLVSTFAKQLPASMKNAETRPLGAVVNTVRPMPTTIDTNDSVEVLEVGAAELPSFGYIRTRKTVLVQREVAEKNVSQFLRPLDIVLIIKGSVGSVGSVGVVPQDVPPAGPGGWIAGQSAIVLRASEDAAIDPRALGLMLRSPFGQQLLRVLVSGATIRLIPLRELMRMQVRVPTPEVGHRLTTAIEEEARIQQQIDRLQHEQSEIAKDIWAL